jgi:hypothetical protein
MKPTVSMNGTLPTGKRRERGNAKLYRLSVPITAEEEEYFKAGALLMDCSLVDLVRTLLKNSLDPYRVEIEASVASTRAFQDSIKMRSRGIAS